MASAKALQKEYDKYLLTAKKYDLDGDLRRAKAYFQRALQLVPKFKKSKTNEKNAEKLKKKIAKYVQKIMEEDIQKQMSGFGVSRPSSSQTSEENDENATQANVSKKDGEGKSKGPGPRKEAHQICRTRFKKVISDLACKKPLF